MHALTGRTAIVSRWLGVTYPEDRPHVEGTFRQLVAAGGYPERLWG
jgi:hypothetical protein